MKKRIFPVIIILLLLFKINFLTAQSNSGKSQMKDDNQGAIRVWNSKSNDDGTIQSLGNGKMCIYEQGPNIKDIYSGPFSTPSFLKLNLVTNESVEVHSIRQSGSAVWNHKIIVQNTEIGNMTDFVDVKIPGFIRTVYTTRSFKMKILLKDYVQIINNDKRWQTHDPVLGRIFVIPSGTVIYQTYVYPAVLYNQFLASGNISLEQEPGTNILDISFPPGKSWLYIIGGPEYPEIINNAEQMLQQGSENLLYRTKAFWSDFTARRKDFSKTLPDNLPGREKLLKVIDDVSVLLKTQQSSEGAVIAGYPYPLGYVRDQYGVSRGFLALGYYEEAKSILNFYWQIWKKFGCIHNAQAIGIDGIFHIHENDEVEIPGYLILQSFNLFDATDDSTFLREIFPMLEWAFKVQKKNLVNGMLPFNGDETYVAGGLLPRSALNDGSAESTMLFIESGERLLNWISTNHLWNNEEIEDAKKIIKSCREKFRDNFWQNGRLITNNPARADAIQLPKFRHGVCEKQGENCLMKKYSGIVWTERNENNRYLCANCINDGPFPAAEKKIYDLLSVAMVPYYAHINVIPLDEFKPAVLEILQNYKMTGELAPSKDNLINTDGSRVVGYDYGFLLYALTCINSKESKILYDKTLSVADQTGSWSEYYLNDIPNGTRCRPWESAIDLEALIFNAMQNK
jgi:hypothetical protein